MSDMSITVIYHATSLSVLYFNPCCHSRRHFYENNVPMLKSLTNYDFHELFFEHDFP